MLHILQVYAQFFGASYPENICFLCMFAKLMLNIYNQLSWISQEDKELW